VFKDFRHDTLEERVLQIDAPLAEGLRKHLVVERRMGLISRLVAREEPNRRPEILVVQEREERHLQPRVRGGDAGPGCGEARVDHVAHLDARLHVGRRHAVDHHLGSAEVDVVVGRDRGDTRRVEPGGDVAGGRRFLRTHPEQGCSRGGHHDSRAAGLEVGHRTLADRPANPDPVGRLLRQRGGRGRAKRKEWRALAVLLEDDVEAGQFPLRCLDAHVERRIDANHLRRLEDLNRRCSAAAGDHEHDAGSHHEGQ
jgi:hypothetical protein